MRTQSIDTTPEVERLQVARIRSFSPARKFASVRSWTHTLTSANLHAMYRRQVTDAFERDTPRITQELLAVKQTADRLAAQGDFLGAATIYETLVTEIFEQSHLYFDEEAGYDDYHAEEWYFPEEEGLEQLVGECIEALGDCLADERQQTIQPLFEHEENISEHR